MYYVAGAIALFVLFRMWMVRDQIRILLEKFKADLDERRKRNEEKRNEERVSRMLNLSRNLSNLTADDLRDPEKVRDAIERS